MYHKDQHCLAGTINNMFKNDGIFKSCRNKVEWQKSYTSSVAQTPFQVVTDSETEFFEDMSTRDIVPGDFNDPGKYPAFSLGEGFDTHRTKFIKTLDKYEVKTPDPTIVKLGKLKGSRNDQDENFNSVFDKKQNKAPNRNDYSQLDNQARLMRLACQAQPIYIYKDGVEYNRQDTLDLPMDQYVMI
jgi:hypothetical protein